MVERFVCFELFGSQPNRLAHKRREALIGELFKEDRNCSVADAGYWSEGVWQWNLSWRCPLLRLEEPDRAELMQLLDGISGFECWIWIALVRRGLLDPRQERCCVFCFRDDETSQHFLSHLFLAEFGVAYLTGLVFKGLWCIIVSCIVCNLAR
ncbi:hypothetical protein P8452_06904 [Trifolium repens]|nr:hypothetical protein P8452_06904 [Trifolium repens]